MKPTEEYFCSDNSKLGGKECVSTMTQDVYIENYEKVEVIRIAFATRENVELQEKNVKII